MIVLTTCHDVPKVVQRERGKDGEDNILISSFPQHLQTSVDIFPFGSEGQSWALEWIIHLLDEFWMYLLQRKNDEDRRGLFTLTSFNNP